MYHKIIVSFLVITAPLAAVAEASATPTKLKSSEHFYSQSQKMLQELTTKETPKKKAQALKKLETEFEATIKDYKKQNPEESNAEEDKISLLYFTMEPTFKLSHKSKWSAKDCENTEAEIKSGDSVARDEGSPTTPQAGEALAWLKALCEK